MSTETRLDKELEIQFSDEELVSLETLIRSPGYQLLRRLYERYRRECQVSLLNAKEVTDIYRIQGRVIGVNALENYPGVLINQRQMKRKRAEKEEQVFTRNPQ